ncbi:hypothetical protein [Bauldia litoralis]|uniref:Uncharacterized protein n=1 Tax=Bauldia litoralis TaxID=665467 RepID=A0A1G6DTY0_9HYPH|nr:hypothetical protein [Bauldia litoralis]SDB48657.1 hypothetical protein SAMN02982931_03775 [Bauldia litoralis]
MNQDESGLARIRYAVSTLGEGRARLQEFAKINLDQLDRFAKGKADVDAKTLGKIVSFVFNDLLTYDAMTDTLIGAASVGEPKSLASVMAPDLPRGNVVYSNDALPTLGADPMDDAVRLKRHMSDGKTGAGWGR